MTAWLRWRWHFAAFIAGLGAGYPLLGGDGEPPAPEPVSLPEEVLPPPEEGLHGEDEDLSAITLPEVLALPASPGLKLLRPPLNGKFNSPHWFDHSKGPADPAHEGRQLVWTGEWINGKQRHTAYDYVAPVGTPVYAAAAGLVVHAKDDGPVTCGDRPDAERALKVWILHPNAQDGRDYATVYAHLDEINVTKGVTVQAGARIGSTGNTGCSSGPHLHFEARVVTNRTTLAGYAVDPYGWTGDYEDPWPHENRNLWVSVPPLYRKGVVVP